MQFLVDLVFVKISENRASTSDFLILINYSEWLFFNANCDETISCIT